MHNSILSLRGIRQLCVRLASILVAGTAVAAVPEAIHYQGNVSVDGTPFCGTGQFKFALVDGGMNSSSTATASAVVGSGGAITAIHLTSGGGGYLTPPLVTIQGQGTGASAEALLVPFGYLSSINVIQGGSGYSGSTTTVTIAAPPASFGPVASYWSNDSTSTAGSEPAAFVSLPVNEGHYAVRLGDPSLAMPAIPPSAFGKQLMLRVWFSDGVHGFEQLSPDQRLATSPYAFRAQMAETVPAGAIGSSELASGAVTPAKLAKGAVAANLKADGLSGVAPGAIVLSDSENPELVAAGYVKIGRTTLDEQWEQKPVSADPLSRIRFTAVWTGAEIIVWGGYNSASGNLASGGRYSPRGSVWKPTNTAGAPVGRFSHTAVWTGQEMIVWGGGGYNGTGGFFNRGDGSRYRPDLDTWSLVNSTGAPSPRSGHSAVWTGSKMMVWGGYADNTYLGDGSIYDPATNTWTPMINSGLPSPRSGHTAVWTGTEMLVWGGSGPGGLNSGARFNPATGSWTPISSVNAPEARLGHSAVWTGTEMIVWGGSGNTGFLNSGGIYNPATDSWRPVRLSAPQARTYHTAIWSGKEMVVWGGYGGPGGATYLATGGRYDPTTDTWRSTKEFGSPAGRTDHCAVWTGAEMIVWSGSNAGSLYLGDGGIYDPATDSWSATAVAPPAGRWEHTVVWTGSVAVLWGGRSQHETNPPGGIYDPATNRWSPISPGLISSREDHTAVWADGLMLIWGGSGGGERSYGSGAIYNVAIDYWTHITSVGAPSARIGHTAVWTGEEMIVWGGHDNAISNTQYFNTGGRYNPTTNTWTPVSTVNAPSPRAYHSAIWTGREMIVWGGSAGDYDNPLDTGASYDPATNSWTPIPTYGGRRYDHTAIWTGRQMVIWGGRTPTLSDTSKTVAVAYSPSPTPSWLTVTPFSAIPARSGHSAIWTGTEMIVWGGRNPEIYSEIYGDGGRFNPHAPRWQKTTDTGSPPARERHAAIWTGHEMLIFGGAGAFTDLNVWSYTPGGPVFIYQKF